MKEAGVSFANDKMQDGDVAELVSRNQQQSSIYLKLKTWKETTTDGTEGEEGRKALTEAMRARVCMKKSGPKHVKFHREMSNGCTAGSREQPCDVVEAINQMEHYKPLTGSGKCIIRLKRITKKHYV